MAKHVNMVAQKVAPNNLKKDVMMSLEKLSTAVTTIDCPNLKLFKKGKVRSVFEFGEQLLIVASDRISSFDFVLPSGIPNKGRVLTELSEFWFNYTQDVVQNHLISTQWEAFPEALSPYRSFLEGRSMLVKKTELIPIECVVRGYIVGSGWKEYQKSGTVCQIPLPSGLRLADPLPEPIFTPAYKAEEGHDENISIEKMESIVGKALTEKLSKISLELYKKAAEYADARNIILADTKFEFGLLNDEIVLIDEVFTPDSSRFWPKESYRPGISPPSFDKQIVRDHLEASSWDKQAPAPSLPEDIIEKTAKQYALVRTLLMQ